MKYRIFALKVEFQSTHPQRTEQRQKSLAFGYTSEESLEDAKSTLEKRAHLYLVKLIETKLLSEFSSIDEIKESNAVRWLEKSRAYPYCHIEPFESEIKWGRTKRQTKYMLVMPAAAHPSRQACICLI